MSLELSLLALKPSSSYKETPKTNRVFDLPEAPTFYPSNDEFADPYSYIESIAEEGSKYGIIKIVPPSTWNPKFAIDTGAFRFRTRKQTLNQMGGITRTTLDYLDKMYKFHRLQGRNLNKLPKIGGLILNFYDLRNSVEKHGGFELICNETLWDKVAEDLGYMTEADTAVKLEGIHSIARLLFHAYKLYILPYELYVARVTDTKNVLMSEVNTTNNTSPPTPDMSPKVKEEEISPTISSKYGSEMTAKGEKNEPSGFEPRLLPPPSLMLSPTALEDTGAAEKSLKRSRKLKELISLRRSDRLASKAEEEKKSSDDDAPSEITLRGNNKRVKREDDEESENLSKMYSGDQGSDREDDIKTCEVCNEVANSRDVVTCSDCDNSYHIGCLVIRPDSDVGQSTEWYCYKCLIGTGDFGFEEGETYTLSEFEDVADEFREKYLAEKMNLKEDDDLPNDMEMENMVETEFWRLMTSLNETVTVDYGADIHSNEFGSGFPHVADDPYNRYAKDPWNLNVLPLTRKSLFRHIQSDISGMTVPWIYIGMMFSTFCWHSEDHYTYSINYQHWGDTKTWYGIPGADTEKFEHVVSEVAPELFKKQPDLLYQLVTMFSPQILKQKGVKCFAVDQRPGQFVVTFPKAYHAGFNHGFNFNEAVNFAPKDWLKFGKEAVETYKKFKKPPVFSHDQLLIKTALNDLSKETAAWLHPVLELMVISEIDTRQTFILKHPLIAKRIINHEILEEEIQCTECNSFNYLSHVIANENKKNSKVYCLDHCPNSDAYQSSLIMIIHFSDDNLRDLCQTVKDRI